MPTTPLTDSAIETLSIPERLDLLGRLWDSLVRDNSPPLMPEWHREELRRRLADAEANPEARISLEELRRELRGSRL